MLKIYPDLVVLALQQLTAHLASNAQRYWFKRAREIRGICKHKFAEFEGRASTVGSSLP